MFSRGPAGQAIFLSILVIFTQYFVPFCLTSLDVNAHLTLAWPCLLFSAFQCFAFVFARAWCDETISKAMHRIFVFVCSDFESVFYLDSSPFPSEFILSTTYVFLYRFLSDSLTSGLLFHLLTVNSSEQGIVACFDGTVFDFLALTQEWCTQETNTTLYLIHRTEKGNLSRNKKAKKNVHGLL